MQRVLAEAHEVDAVGEPRAVGAHIHRAQLRELAPARELVHVEQHLLGGLHRALAPAIDRVLAALQLARVVPVAAAAVGHALVGLLDAREHLAVELLAERLERGHRRPRVAVLGLEVGDDLGVLLLAQPVVVVDAPVAEPGHRARLAPGDGGLEGLRGLGREGRG